MFLDIGAAQDLSAAPFSYHLQYATARRILCLPFADFIDLALKLPARGVHLFNIGQCGSTLVNHVFNKAIGVWYLSDPLFMFDAAMRRDNAGGRCWHRKAAL